MLKIIIRVAILTPIILLALSKVAAQAHPQLQAVKISYVTSKQIWGQTVYEPRPVTGRTIFFCS